MEKKRQIVAVLILLALIGVIAYRHSTGKDLEKYEASFFDVFDTQTHYRIRIIKGAIFGTDVLDQRQVSIL